MPRWRAIDTEQLRDEEYQNHILQGVSRTFALTIPQLPADLYRAVGNAYLLCRIADTIEDDPGLTLGRKKYFTQLFIDVVAGKAQATNFTQELTPLLSTRMNAAEHDLIKNTSRVIRLTHSFDREQQKALLRCVSIMSHGMAFFQKNKTISGLKDLSQLDRYCYHVAGVVGEMLTDLYCEYSNEIKKNKNKLRELAVSFGQGLQMTNILKDIWDDKAHGACWLPADIFRAHRYDLESLSLDNRGNGFSMAMGELIAITHGHLRNALRYTLLIPSHETGIRKFCYWAIGMALQTLRQINKNPLFRAGAEVKISRRSVQATILGAHLCVSNDMLLSLLFKTTARGLPAPPSTVSINCTPIIPYAG